MRRTILVTGAARGLGRHMALSLMAAGERVIAAPRRAVEVGEADIVLLDLADPVSVEACAREVAGLTDRLDGVIHCAGMFHGRSGQEGEEGGIEAYDLSDAEESMRVNALSPLLLTRYLWPLLKAGQRPVVAAVSSNWGSLSANTGGSPLYYGMAKAALAMGMRSVAGQGLEHGIAAIVLDPGWVRTDMGGETAPLQIETSASGMLKAIAAAEPGPARLVAWDGKARAW